jgi:phosphate transport system substrate-binding protein
VEPAVREFLRFVLSREGQQTLVASSQYLPLSPAACSAQLEKLS